MNNTKLIIRQLPFRAGSMLNHGLEEVYYPGKYTHLLKKEIPSMQSNHENTIIISFPKAIFIIAMMCVFVGMLFVMIMC